MAHHNQEEIWKKAEVHGEASYTSRPVHPNNVCGCCFKPIEKQPMSLCANTKELDYLGFGIPIYYSFIRCCILLLLASTLCYSVTELYRNYTYNQNLCQAHDRKTQNNKASLEHILLIPDHERQIVLRHFSENHLESEQGGEKGGEEGEEQEQLQACENWMVKISSTQKVVDGGQMWLRICSFLLHLILLIYIRNKQNRLYHYYDEKTCSLSDFSIMLKDVPKGKGSKKEIYQYLTRFIQGDKIQRIILFPDTEEIEELEERIKANEHKQGQIINNPEKHDQNETHHLVEQIEKDQQKIDELIQEMRMQERDDELDAEIAIIIMSTQTDKDELLDRLEQRDLGDLAWNGMKVKEADDPEGILWENIGVSRQEQHKGKVKSFFLTFLVLAVVTGLFALFIKFKTAEVENLLEEQKETKKKRTSLYIIILVYGSIFAVVLFNKLVMVNLFHKFTDFQRKRSSHSFQFSFCIKYCLGLFFTTALMTLIVQDGMFGNFYHEAYGVIHIESIMYIINCLFVPFFWAINPYYIAKVCKRKSLQSKEYVSQAEANFAMEDPIYEIGKRYAEILEVMWFTFLYFSLIPQGAIWSCLGLFLYYWIDKYNLLRKSSLNIDVSGHLANLTLKLLEMTLFWRTFGDFLYDLQIRDGVQIPTIIMLVISIIYILLPMRKILDKIMNEKFLPQQSRYQDIKKDFKVNYLTQHILYSKRNVDKERLAKHLDLKIFQEMDNRDTNKNSFLTQSQSF